MRQRRTPVKGYKAHVAADEEGGIVRKLVVTPGTVHDSQGLAPVLPARPERVWADSAYDQWTRPARARARRGVPRIARRVDTRMNVGGSLSKSSRHCVFRSGIGIVFSAADRASAA